MPRMLLPLLVVVNAAGLVVGGILARLSYRAYRRTGSRPLLALSGGFGLIALAQLIGGLSLLFGAAPTGWTTARSLLVAVGLAILLHSLYRGHGEQERDRGLVRITVTESTEEEEPITQETVSHARQRN